MKILGVLDCDHAKVSLTFFRQKVIEFVTGREVEPSREDDLESEFCDNNNVEVERILSWPGLLEGRVSPFNPTLNSSPLLARHPAHLHQETFESNGEGEDMSPASDRDEEFSFNRGTRLRMTFRGSRRRGLRRHSASSSETDMLSDNDNVEFLNPNLNKLQFEDLRAFSRQLQQKNEIIQRYEEELLNESNLVKSLEERMSFLETTNKEITFQLDNSKVNIKNLETHMIFLDERNTHENQELEKQKLQLMTERDKLNEERSQILLKEFQLKEQLEEFENWKAEIMTRNRTLQTEILNLIKEKKKYDEDQRISENVLRDKINNLLRENASLRQELLSSRSKYERRETMTEPSKCHRPLKSKKIPRQLKMNHLLGLILEENLPKLYIHALLTCLYEILICLLKN